MKRSAVRMIGLLAAVGLPLVIAGACRARVCAAGPDAVLCGADLVEHAREYDGREITFQGEAIGDIMSRGSYCWVNVSDGAYAIGVWTPRALAGGIRNAGTYETRGDTVVVHGVFNRACPEHGGDTDIHALALHVVSEGKPVEHPLEPRKVIFASASLAAGVLLMGIHNTRGRRRF